MDFWGFVVLFAAIFAGVWFVDGQIFRRRVIAYGTRQAKMLDSLAARLPLSDTSRLPLKPGEEFIYELDNAALMETRTGTRVSTRSFGAATFRVAKGVYFTGGGGRTVSPPAEEEMRAIDYGSATFTNKRVVFVGGKHSREWDFAKLLGATPISNGGVLMAVSSRQKMSGVAAGEREINAWILYQIAQIIADDGFDAAKESLRNGAVDARKQVAFVQQNLFVKREQIEDYAEKVERERDIQSTKEASEPEVNETLTKETPDRRGKKGATTRELEVVGEFFYQDSFQKLRELFGTRGDSEHIVEAELRCDPDNPHSESGYAVAVYVKDLQVGHIPEALAPEVYEIVEGKGGTLTLGARVWLDSEERRPGKSSVQLFLDSRMQL